MSFGTELRIEKALRACEVKLQTLFIDNPKVINNNKYLIKYNRHYFFERKRHKNRKFSQSQH